jgi:hypothetical protein
MRLYVKATDLACLLEMVEAGVSNQRVGFEDADRTLAQLKAALDQKVPVDKELIESALWSANLMDEVGLFRHPYGDKLLVMVSRLTPPGYKFDSFSHLFSRIEK